jgi:hypothetical protein
LGASSPCLLMEIALVDVEGAICDSYFLRFSGEVSFDV